MEQLRKPKAIHSLKSINMSLYYYNFMQFFFVWLKLFLYCYDLAWLVCEYVFRMELMIKKWKLKWMHILQIRHTHTIAKTKQREEKKLIEQEVIYNESWRVSTRWKHNRFLRLFDGNVLLVQLLLLLNLIVLVIFFLTSFDDFNEWRWIITKAICFSTFVEHLIATGKMWFLTFNKNCNYSFNFKTTLTLHLESELWPIKNSTNAMEKKVKIHSPVPVGNSIIKNNDGKN